MERPTGRTICILSVVLGLVFFAWLCRTLSIPSHDSINLIRSIVYPALFIYWAFTLHRRLLHPQTRHYCVEAAVLMVFWHLVRTIKYSFHSTHPDIIRQLWYLYYPPMLLIPTLTLLMALSIGLLETKRLPKKAALLPCLAGMLSLLVLTNDLHQLVFAFPADITPWTDSDYSYEAGYYLVAAYMILCSIATFVTLAVRCHRSGHRRLIVLPCMPILLLLGYFLLYDLRTWWIFVLFGDMTSVACVLYAASVELCIQCGFISSNTGYSTIFPVSSLGAQITDSGGNVCLSSTDAPLLTPQQIAEAGEQPIMLSDALRLRSKPIRFGHVLWQEDISALTEAIAQSEENLQDLSERNRIHRESLEASREMLALQEKNRVTDLLHRETAGQLSRIDRLLSRYAAETDAEERRRLLAGAAVIGAYIKRYGNLLLVCERSEEADSADLIRCFEESFTNLELLDVNCLCSVPQALTLQAKDMLRIYRAFEAALEDCLFTVRHIWVRGRERNGQLLLHLEFVCGTDLSRHAAAADDFSCEAGATRFTFRLQKGGDTA